MTYNYKQEVKNDCVEAIKEWLKNHEVEGLTESALKEKLYDAFWIDDSVTGNASGSYTFSAYEAEKNLSGNWNLLGEAMKEFCCECNAIEKGAEWADVTIRCYLLSECLSEAMEELSEEIEKATEIKD